MNTMFGLVGKFQILVLFIFLSLIEKEEGAEERENNWEGALGGGSSKGGPNLKKEVRFM